MLNYQLKILSLGLVACLASCQSNNHAPEIPETYPVITPYIKDTGYIIEYVADIQSIKNVEIRAKAKGFIDKIYVDEGKFVIQGQVLFSINNEEYKNELSRAKAKTTMAIAEARIAELQLQNVKTLAKNNVVSKAEVELAQAKWESLLATVEESKANENIASLALSYTTIKAPFTGIINRIPNKVGSLIAEGDLLTSISDNKEVYAYFNVSERDYLEFVKEKKSTDVKSAKLVLADNQLYPFSGVIETIESEIDQNTGTHSFRVKFPNPNGILKHGISGKILLQKRVNHAMLIPQKSTFEIQEKIYVFVVNDKKIVSMKNIIPKYRLPHLYIIESGLSSTDTIIYEGIQSLKEGDIIQPKIISIENIYKSK